MNQRCRGNDSKSREKGIPLFSTLDQIKRYEKLTVVTPVKLYPSLKTWVLKKGGSTLIRRLIEEEKLREEAKT